VHRADDKTSGGDTIGAALSPPGQLDYGCCSCRRGTRSSSVRGLFLIRDSDSDSAVGLAA
jgi:hypothetical protein